MTNKRLLSFLLALLALSMVACSTKALIVPPTTTSGTISICHATGDSANPYSLIQVDFRSLNEHSKHADDLVPAPAAGCPSTLQPGTNDGKIRICHASGAGYQTITIAFSGLNGHERHTNDIIPMPEDGCPSGTPTLTLTPSPTGPTPTATITATPEATQIGDDDQKITICHATGSKKNPYVEITISKNGLNGHSKHAGDIIPAPAGGCP